MTSALTLPLPSALEALAWALAHSVWQGLVVSGLLAIALSLLTRASSQTRYLACCCALFGLAAALPVTWWSLHADLVGREQQALGMRADASVEPVIEAGANAAMLAPTWPTALLPLLLVGWSAGAGLLSLRMLGGLWGVGRVVSQARAAPAEVEELVARLLYRLGGGRMVRVLQSAPACVPFVVGWLRPVILLPAAALTSLSPSQLEAVLLHELCHVRRLDWLVNLAQVMVETALFHNPCVWWISARVRHEREQCCDDAVVALSGDPIGYARALIQLESTRSRATALVPAANGGSLMKRVHRLVSSESSVARASSHWLLALLLLASAAGLGSLTALAADLGAEPAWLPPSVTRWMPHFEAAGREHGIDPVLLAVVALVESDGDSDALSPTGAVGVMQVMPATGERIADERGIVGHTAERLLNPAYNIDLGAWYLARQLAAFGRGDNSDYDVGVAVAAYNAGPHRLRAFLDGDTSLSEETQNYKRLIVELWRERSSADSPTYRGWLRGRRTRASRGLAHPLPQGRLTSPYGARRNPIDGSDEIHTGLDVAAPAGSPILSPGAGVVEVATEYYAANPSQGTVIIIRHAEGVQTYFSHLAALEVEVGQRVSRGQRIGRLGTSGASTGPHLHFEVREHGEAVDPARYGVRASE